MSTPPSAPVDISGPAAEPSPSSPPSSSYWRGREELRADLRPAGWLLLGLVVSGALAGLVWWALAPRADFRITDEGPVVVGSPSSELLVADDGVFVLLLAALGLLAGLAAWSMRRSRGVALVVTLAVGTTAAGGLAWFVGSTLGSGPSKAELAKVGGVVTTALDLGSPAALAVAPFVAVLVYLLGVIVNADDGLGRPDVPPSSPS